MRNAFGSPVCLVAFQPLQNIFVGQSVALGNVASVALSVRLCARDQEGAFAFSLNACHQSVNGNAARRQRFAVQFVDLCRQLMQVSGEEATTTNMSQAAQNLRGNVGCLIATR